MTSQFIIDLTNELANPHLPTDQGTKSIYRIPKILTDVNSQAYEPKLASFGPYHHDCRHLLPMEQHKHRALIQFLRRIAKASQTLKDVLIAMRKVEPRLLASYDSLDIGEDKEEGLGLREWLKEKDEFLKLMIVDGCFALEVMLAEKRSVDEEQSEYDSHNQMFGAVKKNYVVPVLKRDMLLLENQLPLLALSTLAAIPGSGMGDVNNLIKAFYNISSASLKVKKTDQGLKQPERSFHILDLYRKILTAKGEYYPSSVENVQSATKLRNAGVSFCKSSSKSYKDISFNGGMLSLPPLESDDTTESLLLNLMAFECLHATAGNEVIAYAFFMDGLIKTADDVALLRNKEIIIGRVGCDGNIVNVFNKITKEATLVVLKDDFQVDVNSMLNSYCKKRMNRWRACFVQTYLKNPWVNFLLSSRIYLFLWEEVVQSLAVFAKNFLITPIHHRTVCGAWNYRQPEEEVFQEW